MRSSLYLAQIVLGLLHEGLGGHLPLERLEQLLLVPQPRRGHGGRVARRDLHPL